VRLVLVLVGMGCGDLFEHTLEEAAEAESWYYSHCLERGYDKCFGTWEDVGAVNACLSCEQDVEARISLRHLPVAKYDGNETAREMLTTLVL
jgi:hypothetical protein